MDRSAQAALTGLGACNLCVVCAGAAMMMGSHASHGAPRTAGRRAVKPCAAAAGEAGEAEAEAGELATPVWKEKLMDLSALFSNLFPLWTVLGAGTALLRPATFDFMTTSSFTAGLSILMFSMGITMTLDDFKRVFEKVRRA